MTIGDHPKYLALGFLRNQGMLGDADDVIRVDYDDDLETVVVRTRILLPASGLIAMVGAWWFVERVFLYNYGAGENTSCSRPDLAVHARHSIPQVGMGLQGKNP
jgi:hypothetical protein